MATTKKTNVAPVKKTVKAAAPTRTLAKPAAPVKSAAEIKAAAALEAAAAQARAALQAQMKQWEEAVRLFPARRNLLRAKARFTEAASWAACTAHIA